MVPMFYWQCQDSGGSDKNKTCVTVLDRSLGTGQNSSVSKQLYVGDSLFDHLLSRGTHYFCISNRIT